MHFRFDQSNSRAVAASYAVASGALGPLAENFSCFSQTVAATAEQLNRRRPARVTIDPKQKKHSKRGKCAGMRRW